MDHTSMRLASELVLYEPDQIFMYQFLRPCQEILVQHTNVWSRHKQGVWHRKLRQACQTIDGLVAAVSYLRDPEELDRRLRLALGCGGLIPVFDCIYGPPKVSTEDLVHCLHHRRQLQHLVLSFLERLASYYRCTAVAGEDLPSCKELIAESIAYAENYNPGETSLLVD